MHDRTLIYSAAFLRSVATGLIGVTIAIHLSRLNLNVSQIGFILSLGLLGAAAAAIFSTFLGDRFGRKRILIFLAIVSAIGGFVFSLTSNFVLLGLAAFVGMLNGMGRDRGGSLILETAILPGTATAHGRTWAFAWYTALQDTGVALGGLSAGLADLISLQAILIVYSVIFLATGVTYLFLSPAIEAPRQEVRKKISKEGRRAIFKLSSLFMLDSIAGGFLATALLSFFFYERFSVSATMIGILFFFARSLNALSHFGAAWLSKRFGLLNTIVFTHIPSSLVLITVTVAQSFPVAALCFLAREALVEMDVPTRQSYVMAIIKSHERTFAAGITNIVRMMGWAIGPAIAGLMMKDVSLTVPLLIGALLKISYDLFLYFSFRHTKPPEESRHAMDYS